MSAERYSNLWTIMADKGPPFVEGRDRVAVAMHQTATRGCAGSVITMGIKGHAVAAGAARAL